MFWCPYPGCTRAFKTDMFLESHTKRGDHTAGIDPLRQGKNVLDFTGVSMADVVRKLITEEGGFAATFNPVQLKGNGGDTHLKPHQPSSLLAGSFLTILTRPLVSLLSC